MLINLRDQALLLMQSLLGVISPNFRMIAIERINNELIVTIILEREDREDLEEIQDLQTEFEALQEFDIDYQFLIKISSDEIIIQHKVDSMVIFRRRE